jgi:hypothetical protein
MEAQLAEVENTFRAVTPEEIEHYKKFGWVKLDKFIPLPLVEGLLAMARAKMGERGDANLPPEAFSYFNPLTLRGLDDPLLRPIIDHCGRNGRALMARRTDVGIRYFTDFFAVKQPTKEKKAGSGGAGDSDWHQDFASSGSDRSGGMVFWTALTHMTPEKGTMAFLNGSHRYGVMGHHSTYGGGNLISHFPELLDDCTSSGNLTYEPGDVTVHSNMTVHSAGTNVTDDPRWTYIVIVNPADACYTGGAADAFEPGELVLHQELNDGRFPVIA